MIVTVPPADDTVTQQEWLDAVLRVLDQHPWALFSGLFVSACLFTVALFGTIYGLSKAGKYQPPVVTVTIVLGIVGMVALLVLAMRPEIEALAVAVGTAIGGLAGALGTAFQAKHEHAKDSPAITAVLPHLKDEDDERESLLDRVTSDLSVEDEDEQPGESEGDRLDSGRGYRQPDRGADHGDLA